MIYMHESATISQVARKCKAHTHTCIYNIHMNTLELVQHSFKTPWETFSVSGYGPPGGEWH